MKTIKSYIIAFAAMLALGAGMTSCQDDVKAPGVDIPEAKSQPNSTIAELKAAYWNDATNYADTIKAKENGDHWIIKGRVITSDEAGNVFKSLVIQDETAALALSINSYNLYLNYRRGQEIVLDVTGMYIGKYNGLQQLGMPEWYANGNAWEVTFMSPEYFSGKAELNGLPQPALIDTLVVNDFSELSVTPEGLRYWQSRLVRFNNVAFQNGGKDQFSTYHSSGVNQNIVDALGATLPVRTSGYSNFWNNTLPEGRGDLVAVLSYYGTTGWQLIMLDYDGCMNWGNPTEAPGTKDNPYTVEEAVALESQQITARTGWVKGYIVGAVAPETETVTSNSDVEWTAEVTLANTLVIGQSADTKDISKALVVALPSGSALRRYGNLRDNPDNYGREILIQGTLAKYMDTYGITGNRGTTDEFAIEGVDAGGQAPEGNGTEASPYNVSQIIAMNPSSSSQAVATGVWATGYIVGWGDLSTVFYINDETAKFTVPATVNTNMLVAATPDCTDYNRCLCIQLPAGEIRNALNLVTNPGNLGAKVSFCGDVMKYCGIPGLKNLTQYTLEAGGGTPVVPPVTGGHSADFNSFNGGTPKSSPYGTYTNATGWTATNSIVLGGNSSGQNSNPKFAFIGDDATMAPTLNGKAGACGMIKSPVLSGGCSKLMFNYGFAFNDAACSFTVRVLQGTAVAKEQTVVINPIAEDQKKVALSFEMEVTGVTGDFTIEIVNNGPSQKTGNSDRVSIWNLSWES